MTELYQWLPIDERLNEIDGDEKRSSEKFCTQIDAFVDHDVLTGEHVIDVFGCESER